MHIIYAEDITNNDDVGKYSLSKWRNEALLSEDQKSFVSAFLQRSEKAIKIGDKAVREQPDNLELDECFKKCKELTELSNEACFDKCR